MTEYNAQVPISLGFHQLFYPYLASQIYHSQGRHSCHRPPFMSHVACPILVPLPSYRMSHTPLFCHACHIAVQTHLTIRSQASTVTMVLGVMTHTASQTESGTGLFGQAYLFFQSSDRFLKIATITFFNWASRNLKSTVVLLA